jgi:hypothetical protein
VNLTESDRRIIVVCLFALGLGSLVGFLGLSGLVLWRLHSGDDIQPGTAALLLALLAIASNCCSLLCPSPLSKSSGQEPQDVTVVNAPSAPVPVDPA